MQQKSFWPRGRVLGGSSSLNYLQYIRGSRHDYDGWSAEGCIGWSYKDVLPYFIKSENIQIHGLHDSGNYFVFMYIIFLLSSEFVNKLKIIIFRLFHTKPSKFEQIMDVHYYA